MLMRNTGRTVRLLQTFATVARHQSVSKAGVDLGLTTSAVSHQLKELSSVLGETLFIRSGRGILLTQTGLQLCAELDGTFEKIERSIRQVVGGRSNSIRIAVCSSFGPGWLAPRLADLEQALIGCELSVVLYTQSPVLTDDVADIFITTYTGDPGYWSMPLFDEHVVAVGVAAHAGNPGEIDTNTLITTETIEGSVGADWTEFAQTTGVKIERSLQKNWLKCSHYLLAMELAKQGMGIALVPDFLAAESITSGKLKKFHERTFANGRHYFVCIKKARRREDSLQKAVTWFRKQVQSVL